MSWLEEQLLMSCQEVWNHEPWKKAEGVEKGDVVS